MDHLLPRGIRNHNPGNIRQSNIRWQGMRDKPFDPEFVEFKEALWGLRALMKVLLTYYNKYGLDTVQSIVNRWAPPSENATGHYAAHVARCLGVKRYDVISVPDVLVPLAKAITLHENGRPDYKNKMPKYWYSDALYEQAKEHAFGYVDKKDQTHNVSDYSPVYETKSCMTGMQV